MASKSNRLCFLGLLVLSVLANSASSSRISDAVFEFHGSTGRSLLQTATNCPVDFENQNYTIITSQCRGPKFAADECCSAFKEFACPFIDEIDDLSTTCATTMFSYITLYGKYPPGLFAFECREGKLGVDCLNVSSYKAANSIAKNHSSKMVLCSPLAIMFSSISALLLFVLL
ncbi:hypothetical protein V2J09_020865 [Rumex salicifolius]